MIRAVLDTNIVISGIFWRGNPRDVLRAGVEGDFTLLLSPDLASELQDVVAREKFAKLRAALGKTSEEIVADLQATAEMTTPAEVPSDAVRDPDDVAVLACAIGGNANYVVTGDDDLLTLKAYEKVEIVTPAEFLAILSDIDSE